MPEPETLSLRAKIVIGADGINSTVRRELFISFLGERGENEARARCSGYVSYRGIGRAPPRIRDDVLEVSVCISRGAVQ